MTVIGIIGGGQLAQMMVQAGISLGLDFRLLALESDESAPNFVPRTTRVKEFTFEELSKFSTDCDLITFDHELVPASTLRQIDDHHTKFFPSANTLELAARKSVSRRMMAEHKLPTPKFHIAHNLQELTLAIEDLGGICVIKSSHGGYDGRGIFYVNNRSELESLSSKLPRDFEVVVEERLDITQEIAVLIVRARSGQMVSYPVLDTFQINSICHHVSAPSSIPEELIDRASNLGFQIAEMTGAVGILAIEMFVVGDQILINEMAPRPHNSGHLTIEACVTSQFENHLRAILDLPLGSTNLRQGAAMVNIIGNQNDLPYQVDLGKLTKTPDIKVHLYGKTPRDGRKLGHITALGSTATDALAKANQAIADALQN
ncbi:5-(carboxyamino)imidazole ribonucleotide synthase [Acidithrix ferrooxidans]|uniref:N5-carboxyaminoimidazole ribonucleotide synthase n=2 Tax=root TaxID=1 RepID=A0A0D8HGB6_9ACTN|nr:5-(carboxyamino)imidazole ribonucleotide synthase [Acidithrix ferrooxidans]KJF16126.1 N5-carboxyaminoimidazole ribonucleotide synthase [Acidithrix ferrooxidans]